MKTWSRYDVKEAVPTQGRPGLGLTGFVQETPHPESMSDSHNATAADAGRLQHAYEILWPHGADSTVAVLTGAGLSTDSGIPDYRSPNAPKRNPMTYQEFIGDAALRQRYWVRNQIGWRHMHRAAPNSGHYALAHLEKAGALTGLITQNVDRLHEDAGSENVVDLHGRFDQVVCLQCGTVFSRDRVAALFDEANPRFAEQLAGLGEISLNPDADAEVDDEVLVRGTTVPSCPVCSGMLKPDFVFFGENAPKHKVTQSFDYLARADALLVAGSSLTVMSGLRFVRQAAKAGQPVVILNRGVTRGDEFATLKLEVGVSEALSWLANSLVEPQRAQ